MYYVSGIVGYMVFCIIVVRVVRRWSIGNEVVYVIIIIVLNVMKIELVVYFVGCCMVKVKRSSGCIDGVKVLVVDYYIISSRVFIGKLCVFEDVIRDIFNLNI